MSLELARALAERASRPDFARFEAQLRSSSYCARPVRLRGHVEVCDGGGRRRVWSTDTEPDGILRKACGNRREAVCPSCAERYRGDAYQLMAAGLRGGKSVPESVTEHPALFVTLTAPSFGLVHTRPMGSGEPRRCRPRRDAPVCPHGVRLSCGRVHDEDDRCLGEPLCAECFDHAGAVVWNNAFGELWRRTTIYLPRALARLTGMTQKALRELLRVSYVKVAEYQRRGLVHLHVVIRLDRAMPAYRAEEVKRPPERFGVELLEDALRAVVDEVRAPLPDELGGGVVRWGGELDVRHLAGDDRREVAGYLAKYATKSTELAGGVVHRVAEHQVDELPVREHVRAYMREAFALAEDPTLADRRLAATAHALGYRGHCLTKSRRYSTTFKALREARERHVHEQLLARSDDAAQRALAGSVERHASFRYVGQGHLTAADALLAASAAARAREQRRVAREERWTVSEGEWKAGLGAGRDVGTREPVEEGRRDG
jgi:replication initiator protein RepSA